MPKTSCRTAVKTLTHQVQLVSLWSSDDDDTASKSISSSDIEDNTVSKRTKTIKAALLGKKTSAAVYSVSLFDQDSSNDRPRVPPFKKQHTDTGGERFATTKCKSLSSGAHEEYELQQAKMLKGKYERICAARRVHSPRKMYYSRITTMRLRASPKRSPLIARKLRF
jgi:hypothetical protein